MKTQNYTIATRDAVADCFRPLEGASRGLRLSQAVELAANYREYLGLDCVAYNLESVWWKR